MKKHYLKKNFPSVLYLDGFLQHGAVEQLVTLLKSSPHSTLHEHLMAALLAIVTDNAVARERCLEDQLDLKTFLCGRMKEIQDKEEWEVSGKACMNDSSVV